VARKLSVYLRTCALVLAGLGIAFAGRECLDWATRLFPEKAGAIERIGGWLVGLLVVVAVLLPIFRLFEVFAKNSVHKSK
jgi:hypothetical protein